MKINDRDYELKLTGGTLLEYKEEFGKDLFSSLNDSSSDFDMLDMLGILWAMIKNQDESFPNFKTWMNSMEIRDIVSLINNSRGEIARALKKDKATSVEMKTDPEEDKKK